METDAATFTEMALLKKRKEDLTLAQKNSIITLY